MALAHDFPAAIQQCVSLIISAALHDERVLKYSTVVIYCGGRCLITLLAPSQKQSTWGFIRKK